MEADSDPGQARLGSSSDHDSETAGRDTSVGSLTVSRPETSLERRWLLDDELVFRGNVVQFLTEGAEYFEQWFYGLQRVAASPQPPRRLMHAAWRLSEVSRLGRLSQSPRVSQHLREMGARDVDIRIWVSGAAWGLIALNLPLAWRLSRTRGLEAFIDLTSRTRVQSSHQKLSIFQAGEDVWALLGSVDLAPTRFERSHGRVDPRRYKSHRGPSHDTGVKILGPAAHELKRRFAQRWSKLCVIPGRRNIRQLSRCTPLEAGPVLPDPIDTPGSAIQILETIPSGSDLPLPPADTLARGYLKALKAATKFIYIEDQYFTPDLRDTQLGEQVIDQTMNLLPALEDALSKGVYVVVLLPTLTRLWTIDRLTQIRRDAALSKLKSHPRAADRLILLRYSLPLHPVYVHSKLLLCDDVFLLLGSANVNRRGLMSDYEISTSILDPLVVREVRVRLWTEHAGTRPTSRGFDFGEASLSLRC